MVTLSPPLKWHGGKHYLAEWVISHLPDHTHYVEPYFGGGAVLLHRDGIDVSEVVNDIERHLTVFWIVLRDKSMFEDLTRMCEATPFSKCTWENACHLLDSAMTPELSPVEVAWAFFVQCRMSRQGLCKDFATLSRNRTRRSMNEQVSAWLTAVEGLRDVHERLKRVVILNLGALAVIEQQDGPNTCFYLDPPYLPETRTAKQCYANEMSYEDHALLLDSLADIKGKFLLSGYDNPLYNEFAECCQWHKVTKQIDNKASSKKIKEIKTECLWMNYKPNPGDPS